MYEGTNPTALQSQAWLTDSLIQLMDEKPFSKISVLDICRKADLSRQTFYNFFSSKEEILRLYLKRQYLTELSKYEGRSSVSIHEIISSYLTVLTENEQLLSRMLDNGLENLIFDEITNCIDAFAGYFVSAERSKSMFLYSRALLSGAIGNILVCWLKQEKKATKQELNDLLYQFFRGELFDLEG